MTIMVAELYDALKSAGAKEQEARKAAEAVAQRGGISRDRQESTDKHLGDIESRLARVEGKLSVCLGVLIALGTIMIAGFWQILLRLPPPV